MTALLDESEDIAKVRADQEQADDLDGLFDKDDEEYQEGSEQEKEVSAEDVVSDLFGDVDDIENEETTSEEQAEGPPENLNRSKEDLRGLRSSVLSLLSAFSPSFTQLLVVSLNFVFRGAEANAGADAEITAAAGGEPERFRR